MKMVHKYPQKFHRTLTKKNKDNKDKKKNRKEQKKKMLKN